MRIIRGQHKGKQLHLPTYFEIRPTTDFAKEALFTILDNTYELTDVRALDLFSGSGSLSYELAARGCRNVTTVEKEGKYAAWIRKTAETLGFSQIKVFQADAFNFCKRSKIKYDIIIADPPYSLPEIAEIPDHIFGNQLLSDIGILVIEHSAATKFEAHPYFKQVRNYGKVHFSFFELPQADESENKEEA